MKRSELLALAERLDHFALGSGDIGKAAAILRQIAEAQPIAWMHDGFTSTNEERIKDDDRQNRSCGFKAKPIHALYTLPIED